LLTTGTAGALGWIAQQSLSCYLMQQSVLWNLFAMRL